MLAACAEEAVDRLEEIGRAPDLLLCDYRLRKQATGIEAIRRIRSMTSRTIPAIVITGDMSPAVPEAVATLDRCECLCKPLEVDTLLALMGRLLESG